MKVRRETTGQATEGLSLVVGLLTLLSSALYFLSDLVELGQGGFSTVQLALTLLAEAAIPFFVVGLYLVQRPRIGTLGFAGTVFYAYSFVLHGHRCVRPRQQDEELGRPRRSAGPVDDHPRSPDGPRRVGFRAGSRPRRSAPPVDGTALMTGAVLLAVSSGLPDFAQTASAGVRDLAFASMGASLLITSRRGKRPAHSDEPNRAPAPSTRGVGVLAS